MPDKHRPTHPEVMLRERVENLGQVLLVIAKCARKDQHGCWVIDFDDPHSDIRVREQFVAHATNAADEWRNLCRASPAPSKN